MEAERVYEQLFDACAANDFAKFDELILLPGIDLEYKNEHGWTMLIIAAFNHSYTIAEKLVQMGADVNACNKKGTTVLMYAKTKVAENRNTSFLDFLILNGANIYATDQYGLHILDYVEKTDTLFLSEYFKHIMNERK